ncbi:MAG: hypothetical protein GY822_28225 [Deltaproteobacteria bacterium]|nr:hypothetical protein [Deltaproteobacteria bacterium]
MEHVFPDATYKRIFGLKGSKDIAFVDSLVEGLAAIDDTLLPAPLPHPFAKHIAMGAESIESLLANIENGEGDNQAEAIDALAHIFLYTGAPVDAAVRLRKVMHKSDDAEVKGQCIKCLAIGKDTDLIEQQLKLLGDDDPGMVASAARLLGFANCEAALPALRALLSPERMFESRGVIWALGEIGHSDALDELEFSLANGFRTVECLIAIGKIGSITSIPKLTPMIISGLPEQRDAAYRSLSMILDENRDLVSDVLRKELSGLIIGQLSDVNLPLSGSTRFHMCLSLARLGEKLDEARVKRFLNIELKEKDASKMAAFFMRKK